MTRRHEPIARRRFLRWSVAAAAGVSVSSFLTGCSGRSAFSGDQPSGDATGDALSVDTVHAAWESATRNGQPLLVLVIPEDDKGRDERGSDWGALLLHGTRDAQAELACCELVCATTAELDAGLPPSFERPGGEPSAFLLEPGAERLRALTLTAAPVAFALRFKDMDGFEAALRERIDAQSAQLVAFVAPNAMTWIERAQARPLAERNEGFDDELVERAPVVARALAEQQPEHREAWLDALAQRFRASAATPPNGARWASSRGCATTVEGLPDEGLRVACGMGIVPEVSQRFLYFYAKPPGERWVQQLRRP